mmetsp:Transcript_117605/g.213869  ORF Transcript_117605/g.213869 Transcript_117605/m.213869 type:complete len:394 (-) Transcript_117605:104-1285(-)
MIITGILLEICAAALGTTSKQLIAYSEHAKKRWIFHIGASINIFVGPVVDASAYAFAPQVVVAPFACLDVIFNALTAPYTLHWQNEVLTAAHVAGTGLVAVGAIFTSVFGSVTDEVLSVYQIEAQLTKPASLVYLSVELGMIVIINLCLKAKLLNPMLRGISLGVIAGVLMGNVFCMKGVIGIVRRSISEGEVRAWLRPTPYILIGVAVAGAIIGHIFMRKGLGEYKGVFMVTIFEGAHIAAACLSGCVVMSEMSGAAWWRYVSYWASVCLITVGMLAINTAAADSKMGRSFHIAQSFTEEEEKNALKGAETSGPVGRVLDDYEWEDMIEEGGFPAANSAAHVLGDATPIDKIASNEKVEESTTASTCTPEEVYMQEVAGNCIDPNGSAPAQR